MRRLIVIVLPMLAAGLAAPAGCKSPPPAAETALARHPGEPDFARSLTPAQQAEIDSAFASLARGGTAVARPVAAPSGRWSDIYSAVLFACDDIEAAVVAKRQLEGGDVWEFDLRTVEDWPGALVIRRAHGSTGRMYEATASIGRFGDRTDRAQALLAALERQVHAFGDKPRLPDADHQPH